MPLDEEARARKREYDKEYRKRNHLRISHQKHSWYIANRDVTIARTSEHATKDPEKNRRQKREGARKRRSANPEKARAKERAQRHKHQEKRNADLRTYRAAHPEKYREYNAAHTQERHEYNRDYAKKHPEVRQAAEKRRRASKHAAPLNDFTHAQWLEMQNAFNHCCHYCGKRAKGRLTQDHITPLSKGGSHTLTNIVPACRACNTSKGTKPASKPVQPLLLSIAPSKPMKSRKRNS